MHSNHMPTPSHRVVRVLVAGLVAQTACLAPSVPEGDDTATQTAGQTELFAHLGTLQGTVTDGAGGAVASAHITTLPRGYETTSDAEGSWRIELLPPDSYQVVAKTEGMVAVTSTGVDLAAGDVASVDIVVDQDEPVFGILEVTATGPDDQPLNDALVTVSTGETATTDDDGRATLSGLSGDDLSITVSREDVWSRTLSGQDLNLAGGLQWAVQLSGRAPDGAEPIGSTTCSYCHPDVAGAWVETKHAAALDGSPTDDLLASFQAAATVELEGATATLGTAGDDLTVTLVDSTGASISQTVSGWIGTPAQASVPYTEIGEQAWPLPIGWRAGLEERGDYPDAQPGWVPYQADRWFDSGGAFDLEGDAPDPATSADARCFACHATGYQLALRDDGGVDMDASSGSGKWKEAGVGCEHCHGPGEEHLSSSIEDKYFTITSPQWLDREQAVAVCAQCHSRTVADGTGLPHPFLADAGTFAAGQRLEDYTTSAAEHWPSGAAKLSRMQRDELDLSPHGPDGAYSFRCFDCHDPHGASADEDGQAHRALLRLSPDDNSICLTCHEGLDFDGDRDLVRDHVGPHAYEPEIALAPGRCTACHMPGVATGLAWSPSSAAGDQASHSFAFLPPQDTIDAFDDAGQTVLDPGDFPIHGCSDCHAFADWFFAPTVIDFLGPVGDPTLRETHVEYQDAVDEVWP